MLETINPMDEWPPARPYSPPSVSSRFQKELIRIGGLAPNGMPILRLEWGGTCTWTPYVQELKYLQRRDKIQTGWLVDVRDAAGNVVKTLKYGLRADLPEPSETYGLARPICQTIEIGIPRWWISQYQAPGIVGLDSWDEARKRERDSLRLAADQGPAPREGFYYLGFHGIWRTTTACCERAKEERRKCFHWYREPSDVDLLYVESLWRQHEQDLITCSWQDTPDDGTMLRILRRISNKREAEDAAWRADLKLRLRDVFNTFRKRITTEGHGPDLSRYVDYGSPTATAHDNQAVRKFSR